MSITTAADIFYDTILSPRFFKKTKVKKAKGILLSRPSVRYAISYLTIGHNPTKFGV